MRMHHLCRQGMKGFSRGQKLDKLGMRGSNTCEVRTRMVYSGFLPQPFPFLPGIVSLMFTFQALLLCVCVNGFAAHI
jgi:hypothetical protein